MFLTILDPDNISGMPIYEGDGTDVHTRLVGGVYAGVAEYYDGGDPDLVTVVVCTRDKHYPSLVTPGVEATVVIEDAAWTCGGPFTGEYMHTTHELFGMWPTDDGDQWPVDNVSAPPIPYPCDPVGKYV